MASASSGHFKNCYIFLLDGGRHDVFHELLDEGRLPNIRKYLVEPGATRPAVSTFPSTTGPAHVPFLTGQFAGTSGIVGYRWFDRRKASSSDFHPFKHRSYNSAATVLFRHDMNQACVTLYELFDKPALVLGPVDLCRNKRLKKLRWRRIPTIAHSHCTGDWVRADRLSERMTLSYIDQGCDFIFSVFYGVDEYSHLFSPHDERTLRSYERLDGVVGRVADRLAAKGELDRSLLIVASDHGHTATDTHIPVVDEVKRSGFRTMYYPRTLVRNYEAAVMESGNSMCMVYLFMNSNPCHKTPDEQVMSSPRSRDLVQTLIETEGMSFVATRAEDGTIVLRRPDGDLRFKKVNGSFDLQSNGRPFLEGAVADGTYDEHDLFLRTFETSYPDLMTQYWSLFSSPRCGDVVLSAEPGFDLRLQHEHPEHHSSHGSIHRDQMLTPFAVNTPLTNPEPIRTVDIYPLICRLCGKHVPEDIPVDGRPIS